MTKSVAGRWQAVGISGGGGTETPAISPHDPKLMLINCDMSGAYRTTDGGQSWELLHWRQLTGCPFCAPAFHPTDPDTVFAAYSYAAVLRVSRDRGATWSPIGRGLPGNLRQIAIDPGDASTMLAATTEAVFLSRDGGETWSPSSGLKGQALGLHFDQSSTRGKRVCFAATARAAYRSTDGGVTWQPCGRGLPKKKPIVAFAGASSADDDCCVLYVWADAPGAAGSPKSAGVIFRSTDRGQAWAKVADMDVRPGFEGALHSLLVTDVRPRTVYAVKPCYSADDTVHRSDDGGETWRPVAFADKTDPRFNMPPNYITVYFLPRSLWGWSTCAAAIDPRDPEHVLFNHYCSIFITTDGGRQWTAGECRPAPGNPAPTERIERHRWQSNGLTNTTTWNYYVDPFERSRRFIAYTDLGLARSVDAGESWTWLRDTGANTFELAFDPEVPGRMWGAFSQVHDIPNNNIVTGDHRSSGYGCVGCSDDGGATWRDLSRGIPVYDSDWGKFVGDTEYAARRGLPPSAVTSVVVDPTSPRDARVVYASIWEHGVYASADGGRTWEPRSGGLGAPGLNMRVCRIRRHPDGTLFCLVTGLMKDGVLIAEGVGLYRSADQGRCWSRMTAGVDLRWLTDYEIDPRDSRVVYLAACDSPGRDGESGLYKTADGGQAWTRLVRQSALHFGATLHPANPDWVYMTLTYNDGKTPPLWLSRDAGATWTAFEDYPFCSAHRVHFDPGDPSVIYVTTYGSSVWKGPVEP